MPIYEYECCKCKISFAVLHTANLGSVKCPNCASEDIKKKISACSFFSSACSIKKAGSSGRG
ncbi:MAG: FmdB family zinc ribbon protein [Dissulfurispiraceae bacterium]